MMNRLISFELLLISTWFIGVMAIQFLLPSLPTLAEQLHTTQVLAKYTISVFLFGKATGMLFFGPMSERYGRRPFMLLGLFLYSMGNLFALIAPTIYLLLFARLIQGIGVSGTVMAGRAMINDQYKHNQAAVVFGHIFLIASIIIAFLPMVGSLIATHFPWRVTFLFMASYSLMILIFCFLFLKETHQTEKELNLSMSQVFQYYKMITQHPVFLGYVLCSIFMIAGESAFNTAAPFLLIKTQGISKHTFGQLITCVALGHLLGTLICSKLVKKYPLVSMMGVGVTILALAALTLTLAILLGYDSTAYIIIPMAIFFIGTGFVMTIAAVGAVVPFPKLIGISSSAALSLNFGFSALSSALVSHLSTATAQPFSWYMGACGLGALLSWYLLIRPDQRRLPTP